MSIHADDLRDIANNHGWPVCELAADEIEELERANATLSAENEKLKAALTAPVATEQAQAVAASGNPEADRIIGRLMSSDPEFDDCADAAAFIYRVVIENKGPDGHASWKDAAIFERAQRVAASPEAAPTAPLLMQDENSGRDGRRYNEWHASRPDARLNAREAAAALQIELPPPHEAFTGRTGHPVYTADQVRNIVHADRKERQLSACNFCLSQAAEARAAATPAAPSAVTDEQIIRAAYQHLSTWDEDHIRFARAVLALAQPAPVQAGAQQAVELSLASWDWLRGVINALPSTPSGCYELIARHDVLAWIDEAERREILAASARHGDLIARGPSWEEAIALMRKACAEAGVPWDDKHEPKPLVINVMHRLAKAAHQAGFLQALVAAPAQQDAPAPSMVGDAKFHWTDGTCSLKQDVMDAIHVYAGSKPEHDDEEPESWESWFEAAFDLCSARVSEILDEHARRAAISGQKPAEGEKV